MKKFLRKTFIFLLSFGMILSGLTTVNASDVNGDDDIMNYVVGGSGTYDDPYILTGDNQYKDMFDARVRGYSDPNLMPLIDFSGVLTGASHYNQEQSRKLRTKKAVILAKDDVKMLKQSKISER